MKIKQLPLPQVGVVPGSNGATFASWAYANKNNVRFLRMSYNCDDDYRRGLDQFGEPIILPHEGEAQIGGATGTATTVQQSMAQGSAAGSLRYRRRVSMASPVPHFCSIVSQVAGYLTSAKPKRAESLASEFARVKMDEWIAATVYDSLKFGRAWIGVDSKRIEPDSRDARGQPIVTAAAARQQDPENQGRPYIVSAEPDSIVDYSVDYDDKSTFKQGRVYRVVIEYTQRSRESFASPEVESKFWIEWTDQWWAKYIEEIEVSGEGKSQVAKTVLKIVEVQTHNFPACPWAFLDVMFPSMPLANMQRTHTNLISYKNEEHAQATFTQRYIVGVEGQGNSSIASGPGNTIFISNENAKVGSFGADPDQARSLAESADAIVTEMYEVACLDNTASKNVAEAATKKIRDMEPLYKYLEQATDSIETIDNWLATMLGILGDKSELASHTTYSRQFDVASIGEMISIAKELATAPFVPPTLLRRVIERIIAKLEPFSDDREYAEEVARQFNITPSLVSSISELQREGILTAEMLVRAMGMPDDLKSALLSRMALHNAATETSQLVGDVGDPEMQDDDSEYESIESQDDEDNDEEDGGDNA